MTKYLMLLGLSLLTLALAQILLTFIIEDLGLLISVCEWTREAK